MGKWTNINEENNKFRLLCSSDDCSLSICNLIRGKIHITTIHGQNRHSYTMNNKDMVFIVSQFLYSLNKEDRKKILEYYNNNM